MIPNIINPTIAIIPDGLGPNKALYEDVHINNGASLTALITPCDYKPELCFLFSMSDKIIKFR